MYLKYNPDNVKAMADAVSNVMEKNMIDIQEEPSVSKIFFDNDLEMKIYNNFGKISKTDLFLSREPKKNYYSIVFEKKRKTPFQIQSFVKEKIDDEYRYSNFGLINFGKRLYLSETLILKTNGQIEHSVNRFLFRRNSNGKYAFDIYPSEENFINDKIDEECLVKVEELAKHLYALKKKYRFNDYTIEEIIKSLLLQNQADIAMEANVKRILNENSSLVPIVENKCTKKRHITAAERLRLYRASMNADSSFANKDVIVPLSLKNVYQPEGEVYRDDNGLVLTKKLGKK